MMLSALLSLSFCSACLIWKGNPHLGSPVPNAQNDILCGVFAYGFEILRPCIKPQRQNLKVFSLKQTGFSVCLKFSVLDPHFHMGCLINAYSVVLFPTGQENQWYPGLSQNHGGQQKQEGDCLPVLSTGGATFSVLCSVLGPSLLEGH